MIPYIWNKIDWVFVSKILIGIILGSPIGLILLKYLDSNITHLTVCITIIFFSLLLMKGYSNQNINNNFGRSLLVFFQEQLIVWLGGMYKYSASNYKSIISSSFFY